MRETKPVSGWAWVLIAFVVGYALVLLIIPFGTLLYGALGEGIAPVIDTFANPFVQHALLVTFVLSGIATLINAVFGLITAWVLVRHRFRGRQFFDALVDIPFVFATPIAGYATIILFGRGGWFSPTIIPIVFAYPAIALVKIFVSLPFVTREVQPVLSTLSSEGEEAAYTLGASRWTTFRRILFPQIWTALQYGIVLTFARMVGEFGAVSVVGGSLEGYTETATTFIFRAIKDRDNAGGYSVSLLLCIIAVVILVIMTALRDRVRSKEA
ncbi:MAG: sulfate ABC transporter permease subunit [Chloroflexota bacterium]|nr:sulfate ABC transporter permease subunit [Chloroflexota bacterium]